MTELIAELGKYGRLIKETDSDKVEVCYNLGVYDLEKNAEEEDTENSSRCLYIEYCSSDYGTIKESGVIEDDYDLVLNLVKNFGHGKDWINDHIKNITSDIILHNDNRFEQHLDRAPASNPDPITIQQTEYAANLWAQYLFERGP